MSEKVSFGGEQPNNLEIKREILLNLLPGEVSSEFDEFSVNTDKFVGFIINPNRQAEFTGPVVEYENFSGIKESGKIIDLNKLRENDILPEKILVYRMTQAVPPDYGTESYWTTDLEAFLSMYEISDRAKNRAYILVSTLERIAGTDGVNIDHMDVNGASLHRIGSALLTPGAVLGSFQFTKLFD